MPQDALRRRLSIARWSLALSALSSPLLARLAYGDWNGGIVAAALILTVPMFGCVSLALHQARSFQTRPTFGPRSLLVAASLLAGGAVGLCVLGPLLGGIVDLVVVPIAVYCLVISWVQPRSRDVFVTIVLGLALTPVLVWFSLAADHSRGGGLYAAASLVGIFAALAGLRRRGRTIHT